jgi:predicted phosphodiesterase
VNLSKNVPNQNWIYTYDYAPDQIWEPWRTTSDTPPWIYEEAQNVSHRVNAYVARDTLSFALLSDNHYVVNGTWQDTREAIARLNENIKLDGVIHLGDFTDGMVSRALTNQYVYHILEDFKSLGLNCCATLGNHDCNYFKNNPDRLTLHEQCELYLQGKEPRYAVDYESQKLKMIFIDSYDVNEQLRYGFSVECAEWLGQMLSQTPDDWSVIVFSHLAPLVQLQAWAKELRNSAAIMEVLNKHADKILAYINGHNHCDHLYNEGRFPIISVNCAKCEYFLEHKPVGAVVPYRKLGDVSQESFDIMTIDTEKREIHFTRFGAGNDRVVCNGKAEWV